MSPTPRALRMSARVDAILADLEDLSASRAFDPTALTGEYVLSTTDEVRWALLPALLAKIKGEAPRLRMIFTKLEPDYSVRKLETGDVDLVISVSWHAPERLKQRRVWGDRFVCLMSAAHPLASAVLSLGAYAESTHLMVAPLGMRHGFIDDVLATRGLKRFVRLSVPDFYQITPDLLGRDLITTIPQRVAQFIRDEVGEPDQLVIKVLPLDVPPFDYYAFWHPRFDRDPRHVWMRDLVRDILHD